MDREDYSLAKNLSFLRLPLNWLRKLYNWTINWASTPYALYALFGIAFVESSCFPIPPDVLLIPIVVARSSVWFRAASICTVGSVTGGMFGYLIGFLFYEFIGKPLVNFYHLEHIMEAIGVKYQEHAFLTIITAAFTPIPYKAITISAGLFEIRFTTLVIASIIGRGGRFFIVSGLIKIFGAGISRFIEKYFDILSLLFMILLIGGFIFLKYVFK